MNIRRPLRAAALAAAALLLLSNCPQSIQQPALCTEKTFVSVYLESLNNPSLGQNYSAKWRADKNSWYLGPLPYGSDLSRAIVSFTLSKGASASINGIGQISGITQNNLTQPLSYTITAEDGSSTTQRLAADVEAQSAVPTNNLDVRFASWNLNDCDKDDHRTRYTEIAAAIKAAGIKVLACCEIQLDGETGADIGNLQNALASAGWPLPYSTGISLGSSSTEQDDLAVISAYPFAEPGRRIVGSSGSPGWPRPMLLATLTIDARKISLIVGHLKASSYSDTEDKSNKNVAKRRAQAKALAEYIRANFNLSEDIILIAGDMNTVKPGDRGDAGTTYNSTYTNLLQPTLSSLQLKDDAVSSNDFRAMNESLLPSASTHESGGVLDHIILSPAAQGKYINSSIIVIRPAADCSDHYPVSLELKL